MDVSCGDNLILKITVNAIKIIENMCSNSYKNYRDRRNIKKGVHQIEKDESQTELGTQIQTLTLKIGSLMRAQAQMPINTPHFQTSEKCGIVHGPGECVVWVMH